MQKSRCPICQSDIIVDDDAILGDMISCTNCDSDLEIIVLHPLQLAEIPEENT